METASDLADPVGRGRRLRGGTASMHRGNGWKGETAEEKGKGVPDRTDGAPNTLQYYPHRLYSVNLHT